MNFCGILKKIHTGADEMNTIIRKAEKDEYTKVRDFYYDLIDSVRSSEYHPKWEKNVYPDDDTLKMHTENGNMYIVLYNEEIIGAMVLNHEASEGYEKAGWSVEADKNEVTVIHLLAVLPAFSRRGIAVGMVEEAKNIARLNSQKALRLDVLVGNLPAEKLYKKCGFSFVGRTELFYEVTGLCKFDLYEYILE